MDDQGCRYAQKDNAASQQVERDASLSEGGEEAWTHLHAHGIDKQDQTELSEEVGDGGGDAEAEMSKQDAHETHHRDAQRYTEHFDLSQCDACGDHRGQQQDGVSYTVPID